MSWDIKVWHESAGDRMRLSIEASPEVPDEVISSIAGAYWYEEVQIEQEVWEDIDDFEDEPESGQQRFQG